LLDLVGDSHVDKGAERLPALERELDPDALGVSQR